jgi:outer membrane protein assembly factor BamB
MHSLILNTLFVWLALSSPLPMADTSWTQWGGPRRNFTVDTSGLASSWPSTGPRKLWSRALGEGHSSIAVDGNRLYTMYRYAGWMSMVRRSQQEIVTAIDASTGQTIWEYAFDSSTSGMDLGYGA